MTYYAKIYQKTSEQPKPEKTQKKAPKRIKPQSAKQIKNTKEYTQKRREFLARPENKKCFVAGCKRIANTIEHTKGRQGYADDKARLEGLTLLLDERYWKPCCIQHNLEFESNAKLSNEYQESKLHPGKKIKAV